MVIADGFESLLVVLKVRKLTPLQFVNPPRLQSVPGFSHFHVFARRKTPEEIDAAEAYSEVV